MRNLLLVIIFLLPLVSISQTTYDIEVFKEKHQECLDKGENMVGCSKVYYKQSDSLLNVVYKKLYNSLDSQKKAELKHSQRAWLKKRDSDFRRFQKENNEQGLGGLDNIMILYDNKGEYVLDRVIYLIDYK